MKTYRILHTWRIFIVVITGIFIFVVLFCGRKQARTQTHFIQKKTHKKKNPRSKQRNQQQF